MTIIYLSSSGFTELLNAKRGLFDMQEGINIYLSNTGMPNYVDTQPYVRREDFRILLSYHYYRSVDLDKVFAEKFSKPYPQVFADSGAFSAFTQGVDINLREYAAWLKRWSHYLTAYSNLDVIGNAEQTRVNQARLEDLGLKPLPVFHTGEPWSYLEWYIERYQYMALGGMVPYLRDHKLLMPWLIQAFKMAKGRTVYHGFGCTNWTIVKALPWYSIDSTSWLSAARYGQVPLFDDVKGGFAQFDLGNYKTIYRHAELIRKHGFDPERFADRSKNKRQEILAIAALSYMRAEQWLRAHHGAITIPNAPDPDGLHLYLSTGQDYKDAAGVQSWLDESRPQ
jgi:hypothetical protein